MLSLTRSVETFINNHLSSENNKICFIWGPRRSGKTTILSKFAKKEGVRMFNFDVISDRELFLPTREVLSKIASTYKLVLIDEVQNYPEATVSLKILHDEFNLKIIATGSSELRQKTKEFDTLAGRTIEYYCLPLSVDEIVNNYKVELPERDNFINNLKNDIQIFGSYPEVYTDSNLSESEKIDLLQDIFDKYVLKDVVNIYDLKNEKLAKDILSKIALQIGSEVSIREIANDLKATVSTVSNYIEIFIKNYILIPLPSFKTNLRRAVSENRKLFFYDLGIRNVLVRDFRDLNLRPDKGGVFENFIISEIEKQRRNKKALANLYFYREYGGKEVDLIIEDYKKNFIAVEIKSENGKINNIFPVKHKNKLISSRNYFEEITKLF